MAATAMTTEPRIGRVDEDGDGEAEELQHGDLDLFGCDGGRHGGAAREASKRVSRLAVEGGGGGDNNGEARRGEGVYDKIGGGGGGGGAVVGSGKLQEEGKGGGRTLPPPHAWLAIEDTKKQHYDTDPEAAEPWARLLRGGAGGAGGGGGGRQYLPRRSSFSVVRRERAAREAWLDRAWEAKRSWHERNGGAPDAGTPVVVVVGKGHADAPASPSPSSHHAAGAVGGGGVAMDVEEVRACRDLGLELPSDCTVEIQCYGLSGGSSPTHAGGSSGAASPCAISSPGADPMDVKARLKVWAQAVALASTTHLGS
ncbi:hypothetical protein ACP4OV_015933 [Aristida adscensionis]